MRLFIIILFIVVTIGIAVFFSVPAFKEVRRSRAIEGEIEALQKEADKISADNSFLKEQVEYLKSDHYKERLAKDKLSLQKPGEQVVVVQPGMSKDEVYDQEGNIIKVGSVANNEDISNFKKWWKKFFK